MAHLSFSILCLFLALAWSIQCVGRYISLIFCRLNNTLNANYHVRSALFTVSLQIDDFSSFCWPDNATHILMAYSKLAVYQLVMHWRYYNLALNHEFDDEILSNIMVILVSFMCYPHLSSSNASTLSHVKIILQVNIFMQNHLLLARTLLNKWKGTI